MVEAWLFIMFLFSFVSLLYICLYISNGMSSITYCRLMFASCFEPHSSSSPLFESSKAEPGQKWVGVKRIHFACSQSYDLSIAMVCTENRRFPDDLQTCEVTKGYKKHSFENKKGILWAAVAQKKIYASEWIMIGRWNRVQRRLPCVLCSLIVASQDTQSWCWLAGRAVRPIFKTQHE